MIGLPQKNEKYNKPIFQEPDYVSNQTDSDDELLLPVDYVPLPFKKGTELYERGNEGTYK